jgi:acetolactate synthase II small subunit
MRYRLELVLRPAEGALLRTLGMTERRGFSAQSISGGRADADGRWRVSLVVDGERPAETLRRQLQKNYDCLEVEINPCP